MKKIALVALLLGLLRIFMDVISSYNFGLLLAYGAALLATIMGLRAVFQ